MFKRLMYDKIIEVLNLNTQKVISNGKEQDLKFKGGYLNHILPNGVPYVREQTDPLTAFSFETFEFIPVAEELSQETPSVNDSDRSDYVFRYSIMFRSVYEEQVENALDEFRDYFLANKQFTLEGYNVAIKTTRADKSPQVGIDGGWYYPVYQFTVYATAIKRGYIKKDADTFRIALEEGFGVSVDTNTIVIGAYYEITFLGTSDWNVVFGTSEVTYEVGYKGTVTSRTSGTGTAKPTYEPIVVLEDIMTTQGNANFSNSTGKGKASITVATLNNRVQIMYESNNYICSLLYQRCMNKIDEDTSFIVRSTFDGEDYDYAKVQITNASRTLKDNNVVIMLIDWAEEDE